MCQRFSLSERPLELRAASLQNKIMPELFSAPRSVFEKMNVQKHILQKMISSVKCQCDKCPVRGVYVKHTQELQACRRQETANNCRCVSVSRGFFSFHSEGQTGGTQCDKLKPNCSFIHAKLVKQFPHAARTSITPVFPSSLAPQTSSVLMDSSSLALKS